MKNEKKSKFNIFDVLVILLVLLIAFGIYYYFGFMKKNSGSTASKATFTIELKTVRREYLDHIKVGDIVTETVKKRDIAKVIKVDIAPAQMLTTNQVTGEIGYETYPVTGEEIIDEASFLNTDGELVQGMEDPVSEIEKTYDYYNVKITCEADAAFSDNVYTINGYELCVGKLVHFRLPEFVSSGYCIRFDAE